MPDSQSQSSKDDVFGAVPLGLGVIRIVDPVDSKGR